MNCGHLSRNLVADFSCADLRYESRSYPSAVHNANQEDEPSRDGGASYAVDNRVSTGCFVHVVQVLQSCTNRFPWYA
jgi:hypothetical protein